MCEETTIRDFALQKGAASIDYDRITLVYTHETPGHFTEIEVNHKTRSISVTTSSPGTILNKRRISNTVNEVYHRFLKGEFKGQRIDISDYRQNDFKI